MSTLKTVIDSSDVISILKREFDPEIDKAVFIKGGEMSQAFSFVSKGKTFVIRINSTDQSFKKDKFAADHFGSLTIPIPKILKMGKTGEKYYAISEFVEGKTLDELFSEQLQELMPEFVSVLDTLHTTKLDAGKFGEWDEKGDAGYESWKEYVLSLEAEFPAKWESFLKDTFLEKELVDQVIEEIGNYVKYLPEDRFLVHGDFGFNNVIVENKKITGVIDWGQSKYGDFMYDLAWLDFWSPETNYPEVFLKYYQSKNKTISHFRERLFCYKMHISAEVLGFFAMSQQKKVYEEVKLDVISLLKNGT